jgi:hypothetical protein
MEELAGKVGEGCLQLRPAFAGMDDNSWTANRKSVTYDGPRHHILVAIVIANLQAFSEPF